MATKKTPATKKANSTKAVVSNRSRSTQSNKVASKGAAQPPTQDAVVDQCLMLIMTQPRSQQEQTLSRIYAGLHRSLLQERQEKEQELHHASEAFGLIDKHMSEANMQVNSKSATPYKDGY